VQTIESQLAVFTTAVTTGFQLGIYQSSVQASASMPFPAYPDVWVNDGIYNFSTGDFETASNYVSVAVPASDLLPG
jgi:hypothetical protein